MLAKASLLSLPEILPTEEDLSQLNRPMAASHVVLCPADPTCFLSLQIHGPSQSTLVILISEEPERLPAADKVKFSAMSQGSEQGLCSATLVPLKILK